MSGNNFQDFRGQDPQQPITSYKPRPLPQNPHGDESLSVEDLVKWVQGKFKKADKPVPSAQKSSFYADDEWMSGVERPPVEPAPPHQTSLVIKVMFWGAVLTSLAVFFAVALGILS